MRQVWFCAGAIALSTFLASIQAYAEPYLAVRTGYKCMICHTNPTGGGKRTEFGNFYAQNLLAAKFLRLKPAAPSTAGEQKEETSQENASENSPTYWTGSINRFLAIGGDLRYQFSATSIPNEDDESQFELEDLLVYVEVGLIPNRLIPYIDEKLAPGGASNREAYLLAWFADRKAYVKAGKMFLPFGLRLEDDSAFIREVPGINYNTPDNGVEVGLELGPWSAQLAISNGTAGGPEIDTDKQYSLRVSYIWHKGRAGLSLNTNDSEVGDRNMQNLFAGLQTGPVSWLAEVDFIDDEITPTGSRDLLAGFLEANWLVKKRHNLKLTFEYFDPDRDVDEDEPTRLSIVWEFFSGAVHADQTGLQEIRRNSSE